jgi:kynurenine formamidase
MNAPGHFVPEFAGADMGGRRFLDLTHSISTDLPRWPTDPSAFEARTIARVEQDGYFARSFWMLEHYCTHIDAPAHFVSHGATVEGIHPEHFLGPAVVLDIQDVSTAYADYELPPARVRDWEADHGPIHRGSIALLRTGWASHWPDAVRYCNQDASGMMHFPGFGADAVRLLIERGAVAIGCDTMSVDPGRSQDFPVHHLALGAGLYHIENLADMRALPEAGAVLVVAPIKLNGGSGAPCRVFALLP